MQENSKPPQECFLFIAKSDPRKRLCNMVASGV